MLQKFYIHQIALSLIFLIAFNPSLWADANWKSLKTDNFTVLYKPDYNYEARQALECLEGYKDQVQQLTGNKDIKHLPIVIYDSGIMANGFCNPLFKNIGLLRYPPGTQRFGGIENWYRLLGVHEYTHLAHLTKTGGIPKMLTSVFGTPMQPNLYSPGWIIEGITTYAESQSSPYEGRVNEGFYDAYIQTRAKEHKFPSIHTATHSPFEFPEDGIYLYGGEFFNYLSQTYGQDKFAKFFEAQGNSPLSYLGTTFPFLCSDQAAKKVYGKSFSNLFKEWENATNQKAKDWAGEGNRLTQHGWNISSIAISDDSKSLYYLREYPKKTGGYKEFYFFEVIQRDIDSQKEKAIVSFTSPFPVTIRVSDHSLYYGVYELTRGYKASLMSDFGATCVIHQKDIIKGEDRVLLQDEIRAFSPISGKSILYSKDRKGKFGSEVWLLSEGKKERLLETDYLVGEILSTPDGIFVSARADWETWSIYQLDIEAKTLNPLVNTPYPETSLSWNKGLLFFAANYDKAYRVYGYELSTNRLFRYTKNGYANFPVIDNEKKTLYFIGLTSDGFDLFSKDIDTPEGFKLPEYPQSHRPDLSIKTGIKEGNYLDNLKSLSPKIHIPYPIGVLLVGRDAVGENFYLANINYNKAKKKTEGSLYLSSKFFKPSIIDLDYEPEHVSLQWSYPLLVKFSPGLSSIYISLPWKKEKNSQRKDYSLKPTIYLTLNYPGLSSWVGISYLWGKASTMDKTYSGIGAEMGINKYIDNSEFDITAAGRYNPKAEDVEEIAVRGYKNAYKTKAGGKISLEYSMPLCKVRKGLWNPNIYLEDLSCLFFGESAFSKDKEAIASIGVELQQEISTDLGWSKSLGCLGYAINKDKETTIYLSINLYSF